MPDANALDSAQTRRPAKMPVISELRLSFIVVEPLAWPIPSNAPMATVAHPIGYEHTFGQAQAGQSEWKVPWLNASGVLFWQRYLENVAPEHLDGARAWKHVVPLFRPSPLKLDKQLGFTGWARIDGFCYPHAVGVVVILSMRDTLPLDAMVDKAIEARTIGRYRVLPPDAALAVVRLRKLVELSLQHMRQLVHGTDTRSAQRVGDPLSIASVIRGVMEPSQVSDVPHDALRLALQGLCSWQPGWRSGKLVDLNACSLPKRDEETAPAGHILMGIERGRAVWFPQYFTLKAAALRALSCYHRNLTLLTLQTESLLTLCRTAAAYLVRRDKMPAALENLANRAAGILGRLYGATEDTYRSWSARRQIDDQTGAVEMINTVRDHFGLSPLQ